MCAHACMCVHDATTSTCTCMTSHNIDHDIVPFSDSNLLAMHHLSLLCACQAITEECMLLHVLSITESAGKTLAFLDAWMEPFIKEP